MNMWLIGGVALAWALLKKKSTAAQATPAVTPGAAAQPSAAPVQPSGQLPAEAAAMMQPLTRAQLPAGCQVTTAATPTTGQKLQVPDVATNEQLFIIGQLVADSLAMGQNKTFAVIAAADKTEVIDIRNAAVVLRGKSPAALQQWLEQGGMRKAVEANPKLVEAVIGTSWPAGPIQV